MFIAKTIGFRKLASLTVILPDTAKLSLRKLHLRTHALREYGSLRPLVAGIRSVHVGAPPASSA